VEGAALRIPLFEKAGQDSLSKLCAHRFRHYIGVPSMTLKGDSVATIRVSRKPDALPVTDGFPLQLCGGGGV
jgi:hypothetical protein